MLRVFKKNSSGFTLLEVMMAVALLSLAVVSILGVVGHNINLAQRSANFLVASTLADEMASRISAEGVPQSSARGGEFENHPGFEWQITTIPLNLPQFGVAMSVVSVVIVWDDGEQSYGIDFLASGG